jgi:uncharacterized membrane protein
MGGRAKMNNNSWFSQISFRQRIWLFATLVIMVAILVFGFFVSSSSKVSESITVNTNMTIQEIALKLGVTPKGLARELELPLDVSKKKSLICAVFL